MPSIPVLLNDRAGGGSENGPNEIRAAFAARGLDADVHVPRDHEALVRLASDHAKNGSPTVVVGGGDGSLHAVAGTLAGTGTTLGILPLGTFNHFAKDLGLPLALGDAVGVIAAGATRTVDVGEANGRVFVNNASVGVYASVVRLREGMQQRLGRGKWPAFVLAVWRTLTRYELLLVRVRLKEAKAANGDAAGTELVRRTPFVFIGNNAYAMEALTLGRREALDAGLLSLHVARCDGPLSLLGLAARALAGRLRQADDFEVFTAEALQVETHHRREAVALDGEVVATTMPLRCHVRPRALRVIVPAPGA